jgi:hypothetical protein
MARGRKPNAKDSDSEDNVSAEALIPADEMPDIEVKVEPKPEAIEALKETMKISGSPLGRVRGKDLKFHKN